MISSWKSWLNEDRDVLLLCLLGIVFGFAIGYFIKDWAISFHSFEIFGCQIPSMMSFGAVISLAIQILGVAASWVALKQNSKFYDSILCPLFTIPFGILTIFNVLSDRLVSVGFITPYVLNLLLRSIILIFIGMDAMCFLVMNALYLIPFYIVSAGVVWLIESIGSIV
jgi:hypothetical protein